jgi:delta 1-pyrroline-5-carboxylate dehydrogenase
MSQAIRKIRRLESEPSSTKSLPSLWKNVSSRRLQMEPKYCWEADGARHSWSQPSLTNVPRTTPVVMEESFGPLAPIIPVKDLDDAIDWYNSGPFGLSSGVVTNNMELALKAVRELRTGTTNINEVPGYRIESSPFGGVKDSGLEIKEGVIETMKFMSNVQFAVGIVRERDCGRMTDLIENDYLLLTPGPLSTSPTVRAAMEPAETVWLKLPLV